MAGELVAHLGHQPRRNILGDEVYEGIKTQIMNRVIAPGSRLNIDALRREFGTSSTPIREALVRLESDGLASKFALRGYTTSPLLSRRDFDDLYELRLLLEPRVAGRAADRQDQAGSERLAAELAGCPAPPKQPGYEAYRDFSAHDARLHDLICELAGNEAIRRALRHTHAHVHLFRLGYGRDLGIHAMDEHRAIVAAIRAGTASAARTAMRAHLRSSRDRLHHTVQ